MDAYARFQLFTKAIMDRPIQPHILMDQGQTHDMRAVNVIRLKKENK